MRKWIAWILGIFVALSTSYNLLPMSFSLLIGWLSPVFGTSLHVFLSILYVMFGDPLKDINLIIIWVAVGLITGLFVRRKLGALITSLSVYPSLIIIMGFAGYRMFQIVQGIAATPETILAILPPPPRGASIATVLNAPIFADFSAPLQNVIATGTPPATSDIINLATSIVLPNVAKNLGLLAVSSLVSGEVGRLIEKSVRPRTGGTGQNPSRGLTTVPSQRTHRVSHTFLFIAVLLVTAFLSISIATSYQLFAPKAANPASYYSETVLGFVLPSGTALITSSFFDTALPLDEVEPADLAFEDCLIASFIVQDLDISVVGPDVATLAMTVPGLETLADDLQRFYPITPQTMFIAVYEDISVSDAASRAERAASLFSSAFGVTLSLMLTQTIPVDGRTLSVVIYQSDLSFRDAADLLMGSMPLARGGLTEFIDSAFRRGMLTPGAHELSSDGTVISVGFVSREATVFPVLGPVEIFLPPQELGLVPYINLFSYFGGYFHSSPQVHTLKFSEILNTTEKMVFSPQSNASTIAAIVPQKSVTAEGEEVIVPKVSIATTLPAEDVTKAVGALVKGIVPGVEAPEEVIEEAVTVTEVETGAVVEEEVVSVSFEFRFPLRLKVVKSLSVEEVDRRQEITVTVNVINDDTDAGEDVRLDDSLFLSYYSISAELVEGTTEMYWQTIPGGSTLSHTYKLRLIKEGIYTLPSATVSYEYEGSPYTATSNIVSALVRSPSFIQLWVEGVPLTWRMAVSLINLLPQAGGNGELILTVTVAVVVAIIIFMEYRGLKRRPKEG
ncbi:MAG: hypothetical protein ACE5Z5_06475 [Candidatus Bathyarchaeia archaeon]